MLLRSKAGITINMHGLGKFLIFSLFLCLRQTARGGEIINGQKASKNSMQYMVSVQARGRHICGGFLISHDSVITAAHCTDNMKPDRVVLGTHNLTSEKRREMHIAYYCKPSKYLDVSHGNDIMLLKLQKRVPLRNGITSIPLPLDVVELKKNEKCTVAGWGITETGPDAVDDLRVVNVSVINPQTCKKIWKKLPPNVICAGGLNTKNGFCQGDSGGPLVCNGRAVGIVSFNNKCTYPDVPNVYTDLSRYLPWIDKNMKGNKCFY